MTNIFRRIKRHIGVEIESVSIEKCSANSFFFFLLCFKWVFLNRYFICLLLIFQIVHRAKNEYVSLAFFQGHSVPMVKVRNNNIYIPISIVLTFSIIASNNFERSFAVRHLGSLQQTRGKIHVLKKSTRTQLKLRNCLILVYDSIFSEARNYETNFSSMNW